METMTPGTPGIGMNYEARLRQRSLGAPRPPGEVGMKMAGGEAPLTSGGEGEGGGGGPEEAGYSSPAQRCHSCEYRDERAGEDQPFCSKFQFPIEDGGGCRHYEAAREAREEGGMSEAEESAGLTEVVANVA